jgi:hypothetical protein
MPLNRPLPAWASRALLLLAGLCAYAQPCALHGIVVDGATGKPIAKARVFASGGHDTFVRASDDRGAFCFESVDAGEYQIVAEKVGYRNTWYKGRRGQPGGQVISVGTDIHVPELRIQMVARAILSGTVVDGNGEPVAGADVSVLRRGHESGDQDPDEVDRQDSDDHGRFRFADLPPGTYFLSAGKSRDINRAATFRDEKGRVVNEKLEETYYPGVTEFAAAKPIALQTGHDVAELTLTLRKAETVQRHLSGTVIPFAENARLRAEDSSGSTFSIQVGPDGRFRRTGLAPGRYTLDLSGDKAAARLEVDLTASDVDGLTIVPHPVSTFDVPLVLRTEGAGPPYRPSGPFWGYLADVERQSGSPAAQAEDGSYSFNRVRPGLFSLYIRTGQEGYFVKQIRFGGSNVDNHEIDLRDGIARPIEVLFSSNVARLEGRVTGSAKGSVTVLLIAANDGSLREATADQEGRFKLDSLAPGKFRVCAIEDYDDNWRAEFKTSLKGVDVELAEGERKQIEVPLVTAEEWATIMRK